MKRSTVRRARSSSSRLSPDDAAGERGGHATDLVAELRHDLGALRLQLGLRLGADAVRLGLGLLAHLGQDLAALGLGVLADAGRLAARLGQLRRGTAPARPAASAWARSAFSMPPWMASVRSAYVFSKPGTTYLAMRNHSSSAKITAMTISSGAGSSGFSVASGMRRGVMACVTADEAEDEGEGDADDRERLGQGEADERGAEHRAAGLGLTGGALDDGGEDQTHADTGADRAEAVADDAERAGELQGSHVVVPFGSPLSVSGEVAVSAPRRWPRRCTGRSAW